jgi:hypothetical protein
LVGKLLSTVYRLLRLQLGVSVTPAGVSRFDSGAGLPERDKVIMATTNTSSNSTVPTTHRTSADFAAYLAEKFPEANIRAHVEDDDEPVGAWFKPSPDRRITMYNSEYRKLPDFDARFAFVSDSGTLVVSAFERFPY